MRIIGDERLGQVQKVLVRTSLRFAHGATHVCSYEHDLLRKWDVSPVIEP